MCRMPYVLCVVVVFLVAAGNSAGHWNGRGGGFGGFGGFGDFGHGHGGHHHGQHRHHHHHHRHGHGHDGHHCGNPFDVTPTFYYPKGLEVYVRRPNESIDYFTFDMSVNQPDRSNPDVSLNTSSVQYGKYFLRDTEIIIRPGDILNISWSLGVLDGNALTGNWTMRVDPQMIKRNDSCEKNVTPVNRFLDRFSTTRAPISSIPPWSRSTTARPVRPNIPTETTTSSYKHLELEGVDDAGSDNSDYTDHFDCEIDPSTNLCRSSLIDVRLSGKPQKLIAQPARDDEVRALRAIIDSLLSEPCRRYPRTKQLIMDFPPQSVNSSNNYLDYVRGNLAVSPKLATLANNTIRFAGPIEIKGRTVMTFGMDTMQDKLMMLHLCRESGINTVKDYD